MHINLHYIRHDLGGCSVPDLVLLYNYLIIKNGHYYLTR